jgi:putative ABC transport system ATP-binding protein
MISIRNLVKTYHRGSETVEAIRGVDLEIQKGDFAVIYGPSGGGKSTLLHLISGIDHPTSGSVSINGFSLENASEESLTRFRRDHIGFVFQFYNLIPALNAVENVALPLLAKGISFKDAKAKAMQMLSMVGLESRSSHLPSELSGGEQQRVAIARAIIADPELVLADEPTGDLDSEAALEITNLMHKMNSETGLTFIIATHNASLIERSSQLFSLRDGHIHQMTNEKNP